MSSLLFDSLWTVFSTYPFLSVFAISQIHPSTESFDSRTLTDGLQLFPLLKALDLGNNLMLEELGTDVCDQLTLERLLLDGCSTLSKVS